MRYEQRPPEPLAGAIGFLLSWNGQRIAHRFARALDPLGLRPPHFGVMSLIAAHPGTAQAELVSQSMIDAGTTLRSGRGPAVAVTGSVRSTTGAGPEAGLEFSAAASRGAEARPPIHR